jgi:type IV pilus assembly protein PilA
MHSDKKSKGFSLIELLVVVAIILIIAAISIPNLLRSRMLASQAAAVSALRNINNSEATYIAQFGSLGYADSLVKLGPGTPCDSTHACLVDELIGCVTQPCAKSGYGYFLISTSTAAPIVDYASTATALAWGGSGLENYCSMDDNVLRQQISPPGTLTSAVVRSDCNDTTKFSSFK